MEPRVTGAPDLQYLAEALARAGVQTPSATELITETLTGGRTGASVTRLTTRGADGEHRFVLKAVPATPWRSTFGLDGLEARLWLSGATRALPAGLRCPTLDVARHTATEQWWLLMDDVSAGILPRGTYDEAKAHVLMRALARLHGRYWARTDELAAFPLPGFETSSTPFATLTAHVARGTGVAAEPWLQGLAADFWVSSVLLPPLLNELSTADADFYIQLCSDHARIAAALGTHPHTFLHGDLRRANISFVGDDVVLFDWELSSHGPAARDLAWYWFLQFWAYPPPGHDAPDTDRRQGLDVYLGELERARGAAVDRTAFDASCELAWLSVLCQIGCCLADPFTDKTPSPEAVSRARRTIKEAIDLARRIQDRHVR